MLDLEQHADPVTTAQADDYTRLPVVPAGTFIAPLQRPAGLGADWLESRQRGYTREEHAVWNTLYERLLALLPGRACDEYLQGLEQLGLGQNGVPSLECINQTLMRLSGWRVVPVPMLIPDHVFFFHLANRRFPAGNFIRDANSLDYIQAPDVFHDVMGHVPLLADSVFADYMQAYGRAGWRALRYNRLKALSALYWYTVEFGLINGNGGGNGKGGLRAYGAGILSSPTELRFALEARSPNRIHLSVDRVMRTDYTISDLQQSYFVIDSFEQLFAMTEARVFDPIYQSLEPGFKYASAAVLDTDHVYTRGTQEYALRGGRSSGTTPC